MLAVLDEGANKREFKTIRQAINLHAAIIENVELLTMHLAPEQISVNRRVNLKKT